MSAETKSMTRVEVLEIMTQVVAERGEDFVYEKVGGQCLNWHGRCPSCLIGHVMYRWGMSKGFLEHWGAAGVATLVWHYVDEHPGVTIEDGVTKLLGAAQAAQDDRRTWGYALDAAREVSAAFSAIQAVSD